MLILTRKLGERIRIGDEISVTLLEIKGVQVKIGIEAPPSVEIHRQEVYEKIQETNRNAAQVNGADFIQAAALLQNLQKK